MSVYPVNAKLMAVVSTRMASSTFELTCLPESLVTCKVRLPHVSVAYSRNPGANQQIRLPAYVCRPLPIPGSQCYVCGGLTGPQRTSCSMGKSPRLRDIHCLTLKISQAFIKVSSL
jgi:hypothetical protein